jgi:hypothetical protein
MPVKPVTAAELGLDEPAAPEELDVEPASEDSGSGLLWPAIIAAVGIVAAGAGFRLGGPRRRQGTESRSR